jgi:ubiquinone biosynthesis protein
MIDAVRLLISIPRQRQKTTLADLFLDLQRVLLLVSVLLRTATPLLFRRLVGIHDSPAVIGKRVRSSLQRMGITYVKLGQFLAMRFDILPEAICRELAKLFDEVAPLPSSVVKTTLNEEFGRAVEELFRDFDLQCIAAASVAQVHRATRFDGTEVAVKVQRPGISRIFAADIRNFLRAARIGDHLQLFGPQSMVAAINEFATYTQREMDFKTEGRTADRLRANAGQHDTAPRIHWDLTTSRVLTMDFVHGFKLSEILQLLETGRASELRQRARHLDIAEAVRNLSRACLRQLFVTGFFHADPHPGNIFLLDDGTVVFVDFGIFGQLTAERRETFASYIESLSFGNIEQSYRHFVKLLQPTSQTDMQQLRRDIHGIMHRWHEASLEEEASLSERHLGTYISEFIAAVRRNNVQMSMDTLLFWRALLTLDATGLRLGKHFDLLGFLREFFYEVRPTPVERLIRLLRDQDLFTTAVRLKQESPGQTQKLLSDFARGDEIVPLIQSSNRLTSRRHEQQTLLLILPILCGSLAILATRQSFGVLGQLLLWTAILLVTTMLIARLVRN